MAGPQAEFLSTIDPEYKAACFSPQLTANLPEPPQGLDWNTLREGLAARQKGILALPMTPQTGFIKEETTVKARDKYEIPVTVYKPTKPRTGGAPLVVFFHGGGFVVGNRGNEETNCRLATANLGCVAVNVEYRLAPEYPFPTPMNDAWDVLKWAAANADSLSADTSAGFIVVGTSAGANMAAVSQLLARDEKLSPPLTGAVLLVPLLTAEGGHSARYNAELQSRDQNASAPVLPMALLDSFLDEYKPDPNSKLYNVLGAYEDYKGLPPTVFQVCGLDPLRDEGLVYEKLLREEYGIKTMLEIYPGVPHAFWGVVPTWSTSQKFIENTVKGLEWILSQ